MTAETIPPHARVLLVEDDVELALLTASRLRREGYEVMHVDDGLKAVDAALADAWDVMLLDVMLPGLDGLDVCRRVRDRFAGAIVMVSARDEELDEILGLELGADDYLTKPVQPRLLLAHLKAVLRRRPARGSAEPEHGVHVAGTLRVNEQTREVLDGDRRIEFTTAEFEVLLALVRQSGRVVSRDLLYEQVFGITWDGLDRALDVYVSRIRHRLGDDPKSPHRIKTVRGAGYLLAPT
jgi:two-component system OmpR family response regulator